MPKSKATPRTLELLRRWNWYYWPVERFNGFSGRKSDLYGIIDYLVITPFSTIGIQSCAGDFSAHVTKLTVDEIDNTVAWLKAPGRHLILIGWRKVLLVKSARIRIYKPRIGLFYLVGDELMFEEKDTTQFGKEG